MRTKIIIAAVAAISIAVAFYIYTVISKPTELNEASPLSAQPVNTPPVSALPVSPSLKIEDDFETMGPETKAKFEQEVEVMKDKVMNMQEIMPSGPAVIAQGDFHPRAHEVQGQALLISKNGQKILRFENFETINGPNLHIYLASSLGVSDSIDLGKIKATKGNVNYELDNSIDTKKYNKVLVWCVPFRVLFSYAELR